MSGPADELRTTLIHPEEHRLTRWFLLTGSRLSVMMAIMLVVYCTLVALALYNPLDMRRLLTETNAVQTLFSSLLSGAILLVSVVVSINSAVLSQEMTDLDNQQQRIDASLEYHREIEGLIEGDITPARPADFLSAVLYGISNQVSAVVEAAADGDEEFRSDIDEFADYVADDIDNARDTLSGATMGTFTVLLAGLNYNYTGQLNAVRGLKRKYGDRLDDEERDVIDNLINALKHLGIGREYFKSLYYKRELAKLSSRLLYISLPVIVFTSYVLLAIDAALFPEVSIFGLSPLVLSVLFAYTIALAPYILLTAYIFRAATITLRTLAAGPFLLREGNDIESHEWEPQRPDRDWDLTDRADD